MMKNLTLILALFLTITVSAQEGVTYFNNVNSELCYELYRSGDSFGAYRVFIVIDEETTFVADTAIFNKWKSFSSGKRSSIAQRWAVEGRRIESERYPYITYPPKFVKRGHVPLHPVPSTTNWTPWVEGKDFWEHPDRPF